jgi:hypothetical protein
VPGEDHVHVGQGEQCAESGHRVPEVGGEGVAGVRARGELPAGDDEAARHAENGSGADPREHSGQSGERPRDAAGHPRGAEEQQEQGQAGEPLATLQQPLDREDQRRRHERGGQPEHRPH